MAGPPCQRLSLYADQKEGAWVPRNSTLTYLLSSIRPFPLSHLLSSIRGAVFQFSQLEAGEGEHEHNALQEKTCIQTHPGTRRTAPQSPFYNILQESTNAFASRSLCLSMEFKEQQGNASWTWIYWALSCGLTVFYRSDKGDGGSMRQQLELRPFCKRLQLCMGAPQAAVEMLTDVLPSKILF